MKTFAMIG